MPALLPHGKIAMGLFFLYDRAMFDSFLAELLSLALVCLSCMRMFFTKRARIDPVAICAPLSFAVALFALCLWGAEWLLLGIFLLSLLVFLTNVRALFRLSAQLYVDHYSILFASFSLLELLSALALATLAVIFRPVNYQLQDFGVEKHKCYLTGSLQGGYQIRYRLLEPSRISGRLFLYELQSGDGSSFSDRPHSPFTPGGEAGLLSSLAGGGRFAGPADSPTAVSDSQPAASAAADSQPAASAAGEKPLVILLPKSTASAIHYEPYCLLLAQKGYRVLTADLYGNGSQLYESKGLLSKNSPFFRRPISVHLGLSGDRSREKRDGEITAASYGALTELVLSRFGRECQIFYAVDSLSMDLLQPLVEKYGDNVLGFYALNRVSEYTTAGYGFVEQTDCYTAWRLGSWRDSSFFIPRYVAGKTDEAIRDALKLLQPVEIIRSEDKTKTAAAPAARGGLQ